MSPRPFITQDMDELQDMPPEEFQLPPIVRPTAEPVTQEDLQRAARQKRLIAGLGAIGDNLANRQSFGNFALGRMNARQDVSGSLKPFADAADSEIDKKKALIAQEDQGMARTKNIYEQYKMAKDSERSDASHDPESEESLRNTALLRKLGAKVPDGMSAAQLKEFSPALMKQMDIQGDIEKERVKASRAIPKGYMKRLNPETNQEELIPDVMGKLNATEKQRYDNITMADKAIGDMQGALSGGESRYSLIGDNSFTEALSRFEEALGRMQSGGAIGKEEGAKFKAMARKLGDSPGMTSHKLAELKSIMKDRFATLGVPAPAGRSQETNQDALGGASANAQASDMVDVISPDGKEGQIPRKNLEAAKKRGFRVK